MKMIEYKKLRVTLDIIDFQFIYLMLKKYNKESAEDFKNNAEVIKD